MNLPAMKTLQDEIQEALGRSQLTDEDASIVLRIMADRLHKAPMHWDEE